MAEETLFELVSPARLLVSREVEMVVVPGVEGDFGALPRHAPLISAVRPGVINIYSNGVVNERIFVSGGFAEVNETSVTVLAVDAIPVEDITPEMKAQWLQDAEDALEDAKTEVDLSMAEKQMLVAKALNAVH